VTTVIQPTVSGAAPTTQVITTVVHPTAPAPVPQTTEVVTTVIQPTVPGAAPITQVITTVVHPTALAPVSHETTVAKPTDVAPLPQSTAVEVTTHVKAPAPPAQQLTTLATTLIPKPVATEGEGGKGTSQVSFTIQSTKGIGGSTPPKPTSSPIFNGASVAGIVDSRLFIMSIVIMFSHVIHFVIL
jgi:hypothetical protein